MKLSFYNKYLGDKNMVTRMNIQLD